MRAEMSSYTRMRFFPHELETFSFAMATTQYTYVRFASLCDRSSDDLNSARLIESPFFCEPAKSTAIRDLTRSAVPHRGSHQRTLNIAVNQNPQQNTTLKQQRSPEIAVKSEPSTFDNSIYVVALLIATLIACDSYTTQNTTVTI